MINEKLWIAVIYLFFSLFLLHLLLHTIYKMLFFFFFQTFKGGVVWKKSKYCNAKYLLWTTNKKNVNKKKFFKIIIISTTILFFCLMPLRAIERKHFHFSLFFFYFFCPQSFSFYKKNSSEIRGLWSIKCFSKMLQNWLIFMYKKTHIIFFCFFILCNFLPFFPLWKK